MRMFVICHDDASEKKASDLIQKWRINEEKVDNPVRFCIIRNRIKSPFFENVVYDILDEKREMWQEEDFLGIITYSADIKWIYKDITQIEWQQIRESMKKKNLDVLGLYPLDFVCANQSMSYLHAATLFHGMNFYLAWCRILECLGYTKTQCTSHDVQAFFCNWWIGKPESFRRYINFYKKVKHLIENDHLVQKHIMHNAYYIGRETMSPEQIAEIFHGKEYFMLHPFILERLLPFFFHFEKDLCVSYIGSRQRFIIN